MEGGERVEQPGEGGGAEEEPLDKLLELLSTALKKISNQLWWSEFYPSTKLKLISILEMVKSFDILIAHKQAFDLDMNT